MLPVHIYLTVIGLCCLYALLKGGPPERIGAAIFAAAYILSLIAAANGGARYEWVEVGVFAVDVAMLLALLALALRANRFWTLWVTALQIIGTAGHAVKLADPELVRSGYAIALALWSYPMWLLLVIGTWNHRRRLARNGADPSWSSSSGRSATPRPPGPTAW
jgi:hypothetical protein